MYVPVHVKALVYVITGLPINENENQSVSNI